jgi:concanavalin A-like lectin/glucanase superfamily protein
MNEPRSTTHWVLALAGVLAVFGLLMKVADLQGHASPGRPAAEPDRIASRDTASPHRAAPGVWTDDGGRAPDAAPDEHGSDAPGPVGRTAALDGSHFAPRDLSATRSEEPHFHHLPHAHRGRDAGGARARRNAPGLEAGAVGSQDDPALGTSAMRGQDAHGAPGGAAGSATPPGTAPPTAQPGPNSVYQANDENGYALNQQIEVPDIGKIATRAGTVSFWLQPGWQQGNQDDASLIELGDSMQIIKNVNFLRFEFTDQAGGQGGIGAPITDWKAGEWHQVTTTWAGNQFSLYLDGQLVSQTTYPGGPVQLQPDSKLFIGSDFPESRPVAPGIIGTVDVRGRPLPPSEIFLQYATATNQGATPPGTTGARH